MKVTKYPQSCLLLEERAGGRILIDVGTYVTEAYDLDDLGEIDAVLYTHRHPDHFDQALIEQLLDRGVPIYANADVCGLIEDGGATEVKDGQTLEVAGFTITPVDIPHVPLVDGSAGPPNTGFLFEDQFFHPGDGVAVDGISVNALAVPIVGSSISFRDAYAMVDTVRAETAVPIHYDFFTADPQLFAHFCDITEVVVLNPGESVVV